MSQRQKLALAALTVAVLVVAFVALRPSDSDDPTTAAPADTTPSVAAPPPAATTAAPPPPPRAPRPTYVQVRAAALKPVGGIKKITAGKGDTVRIEVRSDRVDEGHLHGYDISRPVGPGKRARFRFTAKIEGIFELELEHAGVPIAELRVNP